MEGRYHAPSHMSHAMRDMLATMLTLDPTRRATLPQLWTHPWVTGSLASRSFALPQPLLPRSDADGGAPSDGAPRCTQSGADGRILAHMEALGVPHGATVGGLLANDCNQVTATYFLLAESVRAGERPPRVNASARELGRRLVRHAAAMGARHVFSLDENEPGDWDDAAHFAPSRHRLVMPPTAAAVHAGQHAVAAGAS